MTRTQEQVNNEYCSWLQTIILEIEAGKYNVVDWDYRESLNGGYDALSKGYYPLDNREFRINASVKLGIVSTGTE